MFAMEFFIPYFLASNPILHTIQVGAITMFTNQVPSAIGDELIKKT